MRFLSLLLCRLGFHRWLYVPFEKGKAEVRVCRRCQIEQYREPESLSLIVEGKTPGTIDVVNIPMDAVAVGSCSFAIGKDNYAKAPDPFLTTRDNVALGHRPIKEGEK